MHGEAKSYNSFGIFRPWEDHPGLFVTTLMKKTLAILSLLLLGTGAFAETVTLTVHDYPSGDGPPGLASSGIPLKPGALFSEAQLKLSDDNGEIPIAVRTLARWHADNSIRAVLVQFHTSFTGPTGTYSLAIGEPATLADTVTDVTWDFPRQIITLTSDYLCDSRVVGDQAPFGSSQFAAWEQKQVDHYHEIEYEGATLGECANTDQYYNSIHSSYQLYTRTGDMDYLVNGRKWALHHARDQIHLSGPLIGHGKCGDVSNAPVGEQGDVSPIKTRYTYVRGLVDDYFLWGSQETKDVAGIVVDNFYMTHDDIYYYLPPGSAAFWTEREPAFALIGLVAYYEATNDTAYLNRATQRVDSLYQMQADNGGTAWIHNLNSHDPSECSSSSWGVSPWMTGLLLEGIIEYHKITGSDVARQSIIRALDYLADNGLATGQYAGESFVYMYGCANPVYINGVPDVDNHISHAFAYGYTLTGDIDYKNIALAVFNTCVDEGWTFTTKHYNQQFRSSGQTVAYLSRGVNSSTQGVTGVPALELTPNHPNPFNPRTSIRYVLPSPGPVRISVYDIKGRLVKILVDEPRPSGSHLVQWNGLNQSGSAVASGIYIFRLESQGQVRTRKAVLLK